MIGSKYVRLYSPLESSRMYPHPEGLHTVSSQVIRRHTPFSPYVAPRFPHLSEINSFFSFFLQVLDPDVVDEDAFPLFKAREIPPPAPIYPLPPLTPIPPLPLPTPLYPSLPLPTPPYPSLPQPLRWRLPQLPPAHPHHPQLAHNVRIPEHRRREETKPTVRARDREHEPHWAQMRNALHLRG